MAKLIPTTEEQWRLLRELFDNKRGIVFVSPEMSKRMSEEKLITADHYGEIDYNFGCDVMVDFINSEFSYAYRVAKEQLAEGDEDVGLNNNSALGAKFE